MFTLHRRICKKGYSFVFSAKVQPRGVGKFSRKLTSFHLSNVYEKNGSFFLNRN